MSNIKQYEQIICFNGGECTYEICGLFHESSQICKVELLKKQSPIKESLASIPREQKKMSGESLFANLVIGKFVQELSGHIVNDPAHKDIDTKFGPTSIANFRLTDGTTEIRVTLWGELADEITKYGEGDGVTLTNMTVKEPYDGLIQVSSTRPNPAKKFPGTEIK